MKIIHQGQKPGEKVYRLTCHNCKTVFEIQRFEGLVFRAIDQHDDNTLKHTCPTCNNICWTYL